MSNTNKETGMETTKRPNCEEIEKSPLGTTERAIVELHRAVAALERQAAPVPAAARPRAFVVGDKVRHREFPGEDWTVSEVMGGGGLIHCTRPRGWVFRAERDNLTLIQAAPAAAPAEVDLVERMAAARFKATNPYLNWPSGSMNPDAVRNGIRAVLSALRAEGRLVEPGEIAGLRAERDQAAETQRLRDAAISVCAISNTRESATRHRLDPSNPNWSHGYERVCEAVEREMGHRERAEEAEKGLALLKARAESAESDRDAAFSKETALRKDILAWQDAAMEARSERDEFKRKLAEVEKALDVERRTRPSHTPSMALTRTTYATIAEREAVARTFAERHYATVAERDSLRAELDALKAKRVRRTRPVTAEDMVALDDKYDHIEYGLGDHEYARAARALGFRRVVR